MSSVYNSYAMSRYNSYGTTGPGPNTGPGYLPSTTYLSLTTYFPYTTVPGYFPGSTDSPTSSTDFTTATSSPSSKSRGSSSNMGAIAGGVIGGVVQRLPAAAVYSGTPQLLMDEIQPQSSDGRVVVTPFLPETRAPPMRIYDPDDPTTFPWNQGEGSNAVPKVYTQVPATSDAGHTMASMPTSPPPAYCALPTV
ncbi:hypothetical protein BGW80DRAFT_1566308 [Lactifluus volemus]|nr:hypothetical protein BGW80DRAFT_1566308 [Lactifluus volemus]